MIGAAVAKAGFGVLVWEGIRTIAVFIVLAPLAGLAASFVLMVAVLWSTHRYHKVEKANLEEHNLQYSYRSATDFHFMNTESYEMVALPAEVLGDAVGYLTEGMMLEAQYFEGRVVGVEVPMFVELTVKETTPNIKGAAVQNTAKPALLETGLEIKVPSYVESGNRVKIDTRTGEFVERV